MKVAVLISVVCIAIALILMFGGVAVRWAGIVLTILAPFTVFGIFAVLTRFLSPEQKAETVRLLREARGRRF